MTSMIARCSHSRSTRARAIERTCRARARGVGRVVRVARAGRRLTFVDVTLVGDDDECSSSMTNECVLYAKCEMEVSRAVRRGATIELEYEVCARDELGGRRSGTYARCVDIVVLASAPSASVANASKDMVQKFVSSRVGEGKEMHGVKLVDAKSGKRSSMTEFGICKVVLGGGTCGDERCGKRHEISVEEMERVRESRERAMARSRAAIAKEKNAEDPHGDASKESKAVSDRLFAKWCVETFHLTERSVVADVAGGSGTLSFEFHVAHGVGAILVEPRCVSLSPRQRSTWNNLRRRGARPDADERARLAWLRSEIWIATADEQKDERERAHAQRLLAYTDAGSTEDVEAVDAGVPPLDPAELEKPPTDVFPREIPSLVRALTTSTSEDAERVFVAPFTHIRHCLWTLDSGVGRFLAAANPSLIVGMHSDQATEAIVDVALRLNVPFAVVPCCVHASTFPHRTLADGSPVNTYAEFIDYLLAKSPNIRKTFLPFKGRNQIIYYTPPLYATTL